MSSNNRKPQTNQNTAASNKAIQETEETTATNKEISEDAALKARIKELEEANLQLSEQVVTSSRKADAGESPYAQYLIGTVEEKELVDQHKKYAAEFNCEACREVDAKLDDLRRKHSGSKPQRIEERIPLGQRDKLKFDGRPGYHQHFINDIGNRLPNALAGGYSIVNDGSMTMADHDVTTPGQIGSETRRYVGSDVHAVLCEIPIEIYEADQKLKYEKIERDKASFKKAQLSNLGNGSFGELSITKH